MGDIPLKGKPTPLDAAKTPNLDKLAAEGVCGLMHTIGFGVVPGSDTAHLAIFGYDPYEKYEGRGVYEALGAGLELKPGDVAFRGNFATVNNKIKVTDRRAGRIREGGDELAAALNNMKLKGGVKAVVKHTVDHRLAVVFRGKGLSSKVSGTDPHYEKIIVPPSEALDKSKEAKKTAAAIDEFTKKCYSILSKQAVNKKREKQGKPPANIVLLRGAGKYSPMEPIGKRYGVKAACIAAGALYRGVAKAVGMDLLEVKGITGGADTDLDAKVNAALKALKKYDYVFVHIKATDNFSHDGDCKGKKKFIEKIDVALGKLMKKMDGETYVVVTADHSTACSLKRHTSDPVPFVIHSPILRVDNVYKYSERECEKGALGHFKGTDVTPMIMDAIDRAKKFGA